MFRRRSFLRLPGLALVILIFGCATPGDLLKHIDKLEAEGRYDQAAALVESAKLKNYGQKNALLYYLDRGILLQLAGKYADSNAAFDQAKRLATELFTKSVTTEAGTFLVSDNLRPYYGEDFERAQVNLFSALNYLLMGQDSDALVETRQVDFFLTKLRTDYGHKNIYTEDAFARYLAGLIQEDQGETNDACISYRQSLKAYEDYRKNYGVGAPPELVRDALRTAKALGFDDQIADIRKAWGGDVPGPLPKDSGEVVVLDYQGLPPRKVDEFFEISVFKGWPMVVAQRPVGETAQQVDQAQAILRSVAADQMVRVAFPSYQTTPYAIRGLTVRADDSSIEHAASVAQDIGAIAEKNLKDRMIRDRAKAIARAVVKWVLTQKVAAKVQENKGEGAGWLVKTLMQTVSTATEVADKRSWATLPDKIAVARLTLPAGDHDLHLTFHTAAGAQASTQDLRDVKVRSGRRTFLIVRTAL